MLAGPESQGRSGLSLATLGGANCLGEDIGLAVRADFLGEEIVSSGLRRLLPAAAPL